jgi:hypothetical protein
MEVIFIDEGSADETFFRIKKLKEKIPRLKLFTSVLTREKRRLYAGFKMLRAKSLSPWMETCRLIRLEIPFLSVLALEKESDLVAGWKYKEKKHREGGPFKNF